MRTINGTVTGYYDPYLIFHNHYPQRQQQQNSNSNARQKFRRIGMFAHDSLVAKNHGKAGLIFMDAILIIL